MIYNFGDSASVEKRLRALLPPVQTDYGMVDDPLQGSPFFAQLAESIAGDTDVKHFIEAYETSAQALPLPLRVTMPRRLHRECLLALCHDSRYIQEWAKQNMDFVLLDKQGGMLRWVFFAPALGPAVAIFMTVLLFSMFFPPLLVLSERSIDASVQFFVITQYMLPMALALFLCIFFAKVFVEVGLCIGQFAVEGIWLFFERNRLKRITRLQEREQRRAERKADSERKRHERRQAMLAKLRRKGAR